ncbi:uncharacterized protein RAG0_09474 [Rhynchosporium agropyri]|uniref:N-acetyltransferase domain-containing protein n=1 Tax=Rhynchosporium agropyri TaxID=914238 RepID=A0A1E1KVN6_9HELO|nr:uncharacterized protein RAG0_09474 [Rhynchosporium agropyri]
MDSHCILYNHVTSEQLSEAADFFSANYGVWGQSAVTNMGPSIRAGARVKISPKLLKQKILPEGCENIIIRSYRGSRLIGILFATKWIHRGETMVWVTQLCVHCEHRHEGIASSLLATFKKELKDDVYDVGILSSHPFSISAVARVFGRGVEIVDLDTMKFDAREILASCPVKYVREAELYGALFEDSPVDGRVSCADTQFWVDHQEPDAALKIIERRGILWPLGHLPEGHEYLLIVKVGDTATS